MPVRSPGMIRGSCLCRAVRFEVAAPLGRMTHCHCSMCRKAHGAAFATYADVPAAGFRFVAGEEHVAAYRSSAGVRRTFCRRCGSNLQFLADARPGVIELAIGSLDDDPGKRPEGHIFVGSKAPWFEIADGLPRLAADVPAGWAPPAVPARRPLSWLSPKTEVRESPIHGRGLFARGAMAKDEIAAIKGGAVFDAATRALVEERLGPAEIPVADGLFIGPVEEADRDGGMIFSNHSCEPNLGVKGQIVFVTLRDVAAGEELTHDWAMTDDEPDEMECRCGAAACRGRVSGRDWRRTELQEKYRGYFSWYLERKIARGEG